MRVRALLVIALPAVCAALAYVFAQTPSDGEIEVEQPRDLGIVERAGRRLVQVDVTVTGPEEIVSNLTADDFQVVVGGREIEEFIVDRLCVGDEAQWVALREGTLRVDEGQVAPAPATPPGVSYMFYFDQHHLTMHGRQRSLDLSHDLVDELIIDSNRAMVVSAGRVIRVFTELTSDRDELHAALDRLEKDPEQFDSFPNEEDGRVAQVHSDLSLGLDAGMSIARMGQQEAAAAQRRGAQAQAQAQGSLTSGGAGRRAGAMSSQASSYSAGAAFSKSMGVTHAKTTARQYQRDEKWHTELALARFSMTLGRMDGIDPPKAVLYFADRMRSNAGDHYIAMFQSTDGEVDPRDPTSQILVGNTLPTFNQVIDAAATRGTRIYAVQAEGLIPGLSSTPASGVAVRYYSGNTMAGGKTRFTDANNSLVSLAAETGGQAFLHGVGPAKIARRIRTDLACVYLISFDPEDLPQDRRVPLNVHVNRPKTEVRTRTRVVVESDSARLTSRLTTALTNPERSEGGSRLRTVVVPTGYSQGRYTALVQVQVPGTEFTGTVWDVGLSSLSRGRLREQASTRVSVPAPDVPVVFETRMEFAPGPYELTAVAHDVNKDTVTSLRVEGSWPDPDENEATVGPIALVQPSDGVFVRDGEHKSYGTLGRADRDWVRPDLPAALLAIVCRNRSQKRSVAVERRLEGDSVAGFPPLSVEPEKERCVLISDVIPAGTMTEGAFNYSVRVLHKDDEIATGLREFIAVSAADEEPPTEPATND
jgi:VWFA-related protein